MSKQIESKLDRYAEVLMGMDAERKTLPEIIAWLKAEGVTCSPSTISRFLESRRQRRLQDSLLAQIATGADQCRAVEREFGRNAAPEMATLIKLHRVLILKLSTAGNMEPELLKMADQLMRTAMEFASGQTRFAQKERELAVSEEKLKLLKAKAELADQAKALAGDQTLSPEQRDAEYRRIFGMPA